jgi:hypothetical protein
MRPPAHLTRRWPARITALARQETLTKQREPVRESS